VLGAHLDHVPLAALAGVLLFVGARLLQFRELSAIAKVSRREAAVFLAATLAIVTLGFVEGVLVGIGLSFAVLASDLRGSLRSRVTPIGPVSVVELEGALFASSAEHLRPLLHAAVGPRGPVVIDLCRLEVLDATGVAALSEVAADLADRSRAVRFVVDAAHRAQRLASAIEVARIHASLGDALSAHERAPVRRPSEPPPPRLEEAPAE
jgi:SulP family sulfate permease